MKIGYPAATKRIRDWIESENLAPGSLLPTANELAERFAINPATVLRACQILVAERLLERRGYKLIVRSEERKEMVFDGSIYVVAYFEDFCPTAGRILAERGIDHRLLTLSWTRHFRLAPVLEEVFSEKPAGLILQTGFVDESTKALLKKTTVPTILCTDADMEGLEHSYAAVDYYRGIESALRHLVELGHRHIAYVSIVNDAKKVAGYRAACLKLNLRTAPSWIWLEEPLRGEAATDKALRDILVAKRRRYPETTAILCDSTVGIQASKIFAVPKELSIICLGNPNELKDYQRLAILALPDSGCFARWACTEMIFQLQTIASGRPPKPPARALFVLELMPGESVQRLPTQKEAAAEILAGPPPEIPAPQDTWQKVYSFLRRRRSSNWLQLDLSKLANHSMTRQNGWLGAEPLEHFLPGLRSIHGVPFRVLDEGTNEGRAVLTFRSPHAHSAERKQLPTSAEVKLENRVKALYFLHGCGFAKPVPFAEFVMHYRNGGSFRLPLIPLGNSSLPPLKRLGLEPNVQDWWPGCRQYDFPHAHRLKVFDPAAPAAYERFLYSLEWINPRPADELSFIEVQVDPDAGPTFALVAMTALLTES
jgi:DNA-binding LacI/PurR family transcriptional regulator